jgi:ABC-2 type transport system ATP-binding protein
MQTSFPAQRFDTVFMANLIHVIEDPLKALQESHRILKNDGRLIVVSFTNSGMSWLDTMKLGFRFLKAWGKPPRHAQSFSLDELGSLMEKAGFTLEKSQLLGNSTKAVYLIGRKK